MRIPPACVPAVDAEAAAVDTILLEMRRSVLRLLGARHGGVCRVRDDVLELSLEGVEEARRDATHPHGTQLIAEHRPSRATGHGRMAAAQVEGILLTAEARRRLEDSPRVWARGAAGAAHMPLADDAALVRGGHVEVQVPAACLAAAVGAEEGGKCSSLYGTGRVSAGVNIHVSFLARNGDEPQARHGRRGLGGSDPGRVRSVSVQMNLEVLRDSWIGAAAVMKE